MVRRWRPSSMKLFLIGVASSVQKGLRTFFDTFTSGFATGWTSIRSGWTAASGTATAGNTSYPISTVEMGSSNVISEIVTDDNNSGAGISLWVQDSNNWWGAASKQVDTYSTSYYSCGCSTTYYSCNCTTNGPYLGYLAINNTYYYYYTYTCSTCSSYSCSTCSSTSTTNNYYLKLYKSISGTVSEVASTTLGAIAKSIRVITDGLNITGKAYSDNNFASQTGSDLTHTATGATVTKLHGILLAPSDQNQDYTIDSFQSTVN